MKQGFSFRVSLALLVSLFTLAACGVSAFAQNQNSQGKILAGFFEEWSIYYANYNLANLESNGSAAKLSHLIYAFGDVSASASDPSSTPASLPMPGPISKTTIFPLSVALPTPGRSTATSPRSSSSSSFIPN